MSTNAFHALIFPLMATLGAIFALFVAVWAALAALEWLYLRARRHRPDGGRGRLPLR